MAVAAVVSLYLQLALKWDSDRPRDFAYIMLITVALTTVAWLATTWMTRPEREDTLIAFYRRVRPNGPGWKPVAAAAGMPPASGSLARELVNAGLGCVLIYGALFGVGEILLGSAAIGIGLLIVAVGAAMAITRNLDSPASLNSEI